MKSTFSIGNHCIGQGQRPFIVAELSGNHGQSIDRAKTLIDAAQSAGADAVKLQTYTPEALTLNVKSERFLQTEGLWKGKYLWELYEEGATPRKWHPALKAYAEDRGLVFFSAPFDESAIDFLETIDIPLYKIGSHEVVHTPLLERVGKTGKPVILSTGMATQDEIKLAIKTLTQAGAEAIVLLKCISAYPANPKSFNLRSMVTLNTQFGCPIGISDHTLSSEIVLGATALGACIIEKHLTLEDSEGAIDDGFSLQPSAFRAMANSVRMLYDGLGNDALQPTDQESIEQRFRRSIFVAQDIEAGEAFSKNNLRVVRPSDGLAPKHWKQTLGKRSKIKLKTGDPLTADAIEGFSEESSEYPQDA
ncbi:MAG TPA: pseudaminic acid synthase [Opitutae bacterium]|nr:pseudaminic acid synthase [Opitutae bacterium]|tara:strand:+ start:338 stop:1426 length:1089 start_codon:yes stop_codon:yes gene_type:complete